MLPRSKFIACLFMLAAMASNTALAACVTTTVVTQDGHTTTTITTAPAGQPGSQPTVNANGKPGSWSIFGPGGNGDDGDKIIQTSNTECKNN